MKKKKKQKNRNLLPTLLLLLLILFSLNIAKIQLSTKPILAEAITEATGVPYEVASIEDPSKRPGNKMRPKYIVVHNTANPNSTAKNERDYLMNPTNTASTSWHIAVDEKGAVEAIPVNEIALHAGDREGNRRGISIEICESGNYQKAEENATKIIAYLMKTYHISLKNIKTHQDFSGKECPRKILPYWEEFKSNIRLQNE